MNVKTYRYNTEYQDGTAVKKISTLPNRYTRMRELEEEKAQRERYVQHVRKNFGRRNRIITVNLILIMTVLGGLFFGYVYMQNTVSTKMKSIASLQTELNELKADNNATESRIATNINISEIKDVALNQLGMVYADKNHIVYYDTEDRDYMSQYRSIQ